MHPNHVYKQFFKQTVVFNGTFIMHFLAENSLHLLTTVSCLILTCILD